MRALILSIAIIMFLASIILTVHADSPGSMFRSDASHSGVYDDGGVHPGNTVIWSSKVGIVSTLSPAVNNGVVYAGSDDGNICALNASTGVRLWNYTIGERVTTSPAVVNGILYVGSSRSLSNPVNGNSNERIITGHKGTIYAFNATTGGLLWNYTTDNMYYSPVVADGIVYIVAYHYDDDSYLYALNATTGVPLWSFRITASMPTSPAVANDIVYVNGFTQRMSDSPESRIYALNATTGMEIWNYPIGGVYSSPAVANGIVYLGDYHKRVYALNASTGSLIWGFTTKSWVIASPAIADGIVYTSDFSGTVYALNASTGIQLWNNSIGKVIESSPAIANGIVYIGSDNGKVYALNGTTGSKIWDYSTGMPVLSSPAVANGIVYIGSQDGKIYAIGGKISSTPFVGLEGVGAIAAGALLYILIRRPYYKAK